METKTFTFTVPGKPQGKGRARTVRHGSYVQTYTPEKTVLYENWIKTCYENQASGYRYPEGSRVLLKIMAIFQVPKSYSKARRLACLRGEIRPKCKPDVDNIAKCVADALNGVAYKDDACVWSIEIKKCYGADEDEGLCVYISNEGGNDG